MSRGFRVRSRGEMTIRSSRVKPAIRRSSGWPSCTPCWPGRSPTRSATMTEISPKVQAAADLLPVDGPAGRRETRREGRAGRGHAWRCSSCCRTGAARCCIPVRAASTSRTASSSAAPWCAAARSRVSTLGVDAAGSCTIHCRLTGERSSASCRRTSWLRGCSA